MVGKGFVRSASEGHRGVRRHQAGAGARIGAAIDRDDGLYGVCRSAGFREAVNGGGMDDDDGAAVKTQELGTTGIERETPELRYIISSNGPRVGA